MPFQMQTLCPGDLTASRARYDHWRRRRDPDQHARRDIPHISRLDLHDRVRPPISLLRSLSRFKSPERLRVLDRPGECVRLDAVFEIMQRQAAVCRST